MRLMLDGLLITSSVVMIALWPDCGSKAPVFVVGLAFTVSLVARQLLLLEHNRRVQLSDVGLAECHREPVLATRREFDARLAEGIRGRGGPTSIITVVLADFTMIKTAVGYPTDEALLCAAGTRLLSNSCPGDTVTRVGEDTFAIVMGDGRGSADDADDLASRVVAAFDEPLDVSGKPVHVHVCCGVASTYPDAEQYVTPDELLAQALSALRPADADHRGSPVAVSPDQLSCCGTSILTPLFAESRRRDGLARIELGHQLRQAINNADLTLMYQPKFELHTNELCGVEALVRWPHHEHGVLAPADFLPLVNELQLADALTDVVLHRAISDAAAWSAVGPPIPIAVNLSAPSLVDRSLPGRITSLLRSYRIAPDTLTIEITEDLLINDLERARIVLSRLRESGIRIAIDDFGSGYGSMTYLRVLPVDDVKIDRQFVTPITRDPRAAAIVKATIDLAEALDLTAIAEGIEDLSTARKLRQYGCRYGQGNYFSPPVPADMIRPTG
jgi:EAL domain-containing protein (putative c-di-GMP-specific phosphodiesterase class I)/GGDEF domain-containing protein